MVLAALLRRRPLVPPPPPGLRCGETNRNPSHRSKIIVGMYGIALPKEIYSYMMDGTYCWRKEGEKDETTKSNCDWMLRWCLPTNPPQEALAPNHFSKQSPASTAGSAVPAVSPSPYPSADPVGVDKYSCVESGRTVYSFTVT